MVDLAEVGKKIIGVERIPDGVLIFVKRDVEDHQGNGALSIPESEMIRTIYDLLQKSGDDAEALLRIFRYNHPEKEGLITEFLGSNGRALLAISPCAAYSFISDISQTTEITLKLSPGSEYYS